MSNPDVQVPPVDQPAASAPAADPATPAPVVAQESYSGLTLEARRNDESGHWEFGVNLSGAFVILAVKKLGRVNDQIREQIDPGFAARRAQHYRDEVLGR